MRENIIKTIEKEKIIAIIRGADIEQAVKASKAIYDGGIKLVEVTFNQKSPESFIQTVNSIKAIKSACPEMIVGAGTVLNTEQVDLALSAGAEYIVSPDTDEKVIAYSVKNGLVSLPGAYTATEVKKAHEAGADFVKLFPCTDGAVQYIKALKAPLSHIKFLAVGGVTAENAGDFIKAGAVGIGVGGALINKKWLDEGEYEKITELAKKFVESVK